MEIFYTRPGLWFGLMATVIGLMILLFLIEAFILQPKWKKSYKPPADRWGYYYETYWSEGRAVVTPILYMIAAVIGVICFVLGLVSAVYVEDHFPREVELTVSSPTTIAEDGTRYVELKLDSRFSLTYICGETDHCEGLAVGDRIIFTRYADDNDVIHRYDLHRK